ncbi:hypothetical protein K458DRAFT_9185 [Lentithecium fluviatile CBS 122367]|uniref:Uncharacterized protein n=1 Tax=Lentithecium fluviatile CBS 122367 TaxID=1168545 RepID=A0A6G1JNA5_9PLEO|nr:hypothetical protein K458DRAFT_9185 [Lentithecium fluviatile CBS 122367]
MVQFRQHQSAPCLPSSSQSPIDSILSHLLWIYLLLIALNLPYAFSHLWRSVSRFTSTSFHQASISSFPRKPVDSACRPACDYLRTKTTTASHGAPQNQRTGDQHVPHSGDVWVH